MRFSLSKTPLFRSKKWLIMHTVNRDHEPPFWTCLQLNPNSDRKIRQHGRKKWSMKSSDPYLSFHLSNWITKLVHTEKTRKENLFISPATIPSKSTGKKIHAPDWLITSTIMQFGACPTSSESHLPDISPVIVTSSRPTVIDRHFANKMATDMMYQCSCYFLTTHSMEHLLKHDCYYYENGR